MAEDDGLLTYDPIALQQIEELDEQDQKKLSEGLSDIFSKILIMFIDLQTQSFIHVSKVNTINCLLNEKTPLFISGYVVTVQICPDSFQWHICSITNKESAKAYRIHKIA